jgi:hypothetical protein
VQSRWDLDQWAFEVHFDGIAHGVQRGYAYSPVWQRPLVTLGRRSKVHICNIKKHDEKTLDGAKFEKAASIVIKST